jgi:hypothetical protein
MKTKTKPIWKMTLKEFWTAKPVDPANGPMYNNVQRLLDQWEWSKEICDALMARLPVPNRVVEVYLRDTKSSMPPWRMKDYQKLVRKYPHPCVDENGTHYDLNGRALCG